LRRTDADSAVKCAEIDRIEIVLEILKIAEYARDIFGRKEEFLNLYNKFV